MNRQQESSLEYQKRIQKALTFIRENLDKPITLKEVAAAACFSSYHFHRIFAAIMQETVGEYITRKKLEQAAIKLAYVQGVTVSDVAFEFGYASVSSFSKAFNRWFGCRPTEIARIRQGLDSGNGFQESEREKSLRSDQLFASPSLEDWESKFREIDGRVRVQTISAFDLYYLTSPEGYDFTSISRTWLTLAEKLEDRQLDIKDCERFAISHDHPGLTQLSKCRYDACIALPEQWQGNLSLTKTTIPSGRYAIFPVEGPEASILGQYLEFYTVWMPPSGYEPDNFPVLEHYLLPCRQGHMTVELWAKIRRLSLV